MRHKNDLNAHMDLKILVILLTSIICTKNETVKFDNKFATNILNFKTIETEKDIIISISSNEYLPLKGDWRSEDNSLYLGDFRIGDTGVYACLYLNISCLNLFDSCFENFENHVFEFRTSKKMIENKEKLECRLHLLKREDLEKIFQNYLYTIAVFKYSNKDAKGQAYFELSNSIINSEIICSVKFVYNSDKACNSNEKISVVYETEVDNESYEDQTLFKRAMITISKQNLLGAFIFGPCGFFLGLIISKYLLKRS